MEKVEFDRRHELGRVTKPTREQFEKFKTYYDLNKSSQENLDHIVNDLKLMNENKFLRFEYYLTGGDKNTKFFDRILYKACNPRVNYLANKKLAENAIGRRITLSVLKVHLNQLSKNAQDYGFFEKICDETTDIENSEEPAENSEELAENYVRYGKGNKDAVKKYLTCEVNKLIATGHELEIYRRLMKTVKDLENEIFY